jgi:hypothetical protein
MNFNEVTTIIALVFAGGTALGTIGLALFAFKEIKHVSREYRKRQLNEIIEWATSAREWDFTEEDNKRLKNSEEPWIASWIIISRHIELLMSILRTGHIMDKVASNFKRPSFEKNIKGLLTELIKMQMHLIGLRKQIDFTAARTPPNFIAALDSSKAQQAQLRQAAENVIAEAAELI